MSVVPDCYAVWNRACLDAGGAHARAGDRALANLLLAHGLVMNGGLVHAMDVLEPDALSAACDGYRFFGFAEVAGLFETARQITKPSDNDEEATNRHYWRLIPDDSTIMNAFEQWFALHREDFAPLD